MPKTTFNFEQLFNTAPLQSNKVDLPKFGITVALRKQIIEEYLLWAYDNQLNIDIPGVHLKYLNELRSKE